MLLTREQILKSNDRKHVEIEIPEWGGKVRIGVLSGYDREKAEEEFSKTNLNAQDKYNRRAFFVAISVIDEKGNRIFTMDDVKALNEKNWEALDRIVDSSRLLNKIGDEAVEALAKN